MKEKSQECLTDNFKLGDVGKDLSKTYLLPDPAAPGLIPRVPEIQGKKFVNAANFNQGHC